MLLPLHVGIMNGLVLAHVRISFVLYGEVLLRALSLRSFVLLRSSSGMGIHLSSLGALLLLLLNWVIPTPLPSFVTLPCALLVMLIEPGNLLLDLMGGSLDVGDGERLPQAFAVGLLLSAPATWLVLLLGGSLAFYLVLWLGILAVVTLLRFALSGRSTEPSAARVADDQGDGPLWKFRFLRLGLIALVVVGTYLAVRWGPRDTDSLAYLAHIQERMISPVLQPRDPILGLESLTVSPRLWLNPWLMAQGGLVLLTRADPVGVVFDELPPLLALLSLAACYGLARTLFGRRDLAFFAVLVQLFLFTATLHSHDGPGNAFFARAAEDKMLLWLVIMPVAVRWGLRWLADGRRADALGYALAGIIAGLLHPIGAVLAGLFAGSILIARLPFHHERADVMRLAFLLLIPLLLLPYIVFEQMNEPFVPYTVEAGTPLVDFRMELAARRLLFLPGGWTMVHPAMVAYPAIILALLLGLRLLPRLRCSLAVQYLLGVTFVPLFILYNPVTASLLARLITPWLLWRVTWLMPFGLLLAAALVPPWSLPWRRWRRLRWLLPVSVGFLVIFLSLFNLRDSFRVWKGENFWLPPEDRTFVLNAGPLLRSDRPVLAPPQINRIIPALLPSAHALEFRGTPQLPERRRDVDAFYQEERFGRQGWEMVERYDLGYVVVPSQSALDASLADLPDEFQRLYDSGVWVLYGVEDVPGPTD